MRAIFKHPGSKWSMMDDLKALTENAECTWDYIDRLRMALAAACKERPELKAENDRLHQENSG